MSAIFGFILGVIVTIILAILALFGFVATAVPADQGEIAIATVQAEPAQTAQLVDAAWLRDEMAFNSDLVVVALMPEN